MAADQADDDGKTRRELAAEATRQELLDAGAELAEEAFRIGRADPLRLLSPTAIARRASERSARGPVTKGMLYHLWPTPQASDEHSQADRLDAYRLKLFTRIFTTSFNAQMLQEATKALQDASGQQLPAQAAMICNGANVQFSSYRYGGPQADDYRFRTLLAIVGDRLRASGMLDEGDLQKTAAPDAYSDLKSLYSALLDAYGLQIIPPLDLDDLTQMLWAIQDGLTLNSWHFERLNEKHSLQEWEDGWDESEFEWSSFAIIAFALIRAVTRKRVSAE